MSSENSGIDTVGGGDGQLMNIFSSKCGDIKDNEKHSHDTYRCGVCAVYGQVNNRPHAQQIVVALSLALHQPHIYRLALLSYYDVVRSCVVPLTKMAHIIATRTRIDMHPATFKWMRNENVAEERITLDCIQFISIKCTHVPYSFVRRFDEYFVGADLHIEYILLSAQRCGERESEKANTVHETTGHSRIESR